MNVPSKSVCVSPRFQRDFRYQRGHFYQFLGRLSISKESMRTFPKQPCETIPATPVRGTSATALIRRRWSEGIVRAPSGNFASRSVNRHVLKPHYFFPANQWVVVFCLTDWEVHEHLCVFFHSCCENRWSYLPMSIDMSLYNIEPRLPTSQLLF